MQVTKTNQTPHDHNERWKNMKTRIRRSQAYEAQRLTALRVAPAYGIQANKMNCSKVIKALKAVRSFIAGAIVMAIGVSITLFLIGILVSGVLFLLVGFLSLIS